MSEAKGEFGEPWKGMEYDADGRPQYFTVTRDERAVFQMRDGPSHLFSPLMNSDEQEVVRLRIQAAVNFLAGVPSERLDPSDPAACMFLAWLRGDDAAALAWADEVQGRANAPEGYVSRAELEERLEAVTTPTLEEGATGPEQQAAAWSAVWGALKDAGMYSHWSSGRCGRERAVDFVKHLAAEARRGAEVPADE